MANQWKSKVLLLVALIVVVGGAAVFFSARKPAPDAEPEPAVELGPSYEEESAPSGETGGEPAASQEDLVARGQELAASLGCVACHSTDGTPLVGPTWQGLYGSERRLAGGQIVVADEAYLRESILQPDAQVVEGFPPEVMSAAVAGVWDQLSQPETVDALVAYIESLGHPPGRPAVEQHR